MKSAFAVALLALLFASSAPAQEEANIGMFYSSLGAQGEWIPMDGGSYVWRPTGVEAGWRPYTDGHWVWTDDGWYWASDEPWAWATYHYGRWYYDDYYGWVWVPGYDWAPAWVDWRYGDDYIGWAPLSPYAVFSVSWGVHYRRYWATPYFYWSFVDCHYMGYHDLHRYIYRTADNTRFIGRTRTAGNVRYDNGRIITRGPERAYVEQRGNIRIPRATFTDVRERGQAGVVRLNGADRINVYRPRIESPRVTPMTRPDRVRVDDHPMGLDPRGTDIRRGETTRPRESVVPRVDERRSNDAREPRVVRPERPVRVPDASIRTPGSVRVPDRAIRTPQGSVSAPERQWSAPRSFRNERPQERSVAPSGRNWSPRQERSVAPSGRNWSPPQRSVAPGRSGGGETRSPGGRTESPRGGGGGRGGRR